MQNEMRDRLVELIHDASYNNGCVSWEELADFLVENGVIVPPCKVGDTVYVITIKRPCYACILCTDYCHRNCSFDDKNKLVVKTARVVAIEYETKGKFCVEIDRSKICNSYNYTYWFEDFGKTVFPTKEEAEKALKEGVNNG